MAETLIIWGDERQELLEAERPVVERRRQAEAVFDQRLLAGAVAVVHPADLRQGDVGLVDHHQELRREVVEQAGRALARGAAAQVARVVLDPGAGADLEQHVDVEVGARLEALRLEQLARLAQLLQPLGELGADQAHGALDRGALGDEVLGRVDGAAVELAWMASPVSGWILVIRSTVSPQSSMRTACSS